MAKSVKEAIEAQDQDRKAQDKSAKELRENVKALGIDKLVSALVEAEPETDLYLGTYTATLIIPVKSMKHMLEVIEATELVTGLDFDNTSDDAANATRYFSSSQAWWFTIQAKVSRDEADETALCRRVQTGIKTVEVPEYKLECTDPT